MMTITAVPLIKLTASASIMAMAGNDRMKYCVSEKIKGKGDLSLSPQHDLKDN